jgi:hypothetical protein
MKSETKNNILKKLKKDWWIYLIVAILFLITGIIISNNEGNVAGEIRQLRQEQQRRSIGESFRERQKEEQRQRERTWDRMNPPRDYDW